MKRPSKYKAVKIVTEEGVFDSKAEYREWCNLKLRLRAGEISDLKRQEPLQLVVGVQIAGEPRKRPPVRYVADFTYIENGKKVYHDCKGVETPMFRLKQHLCKVILDIDIRVTR